MTAGYGPFPGGRRRKPGTRSAPPSKLFFQAGRQDSVVPKDALETLIKAGSQPKKVSWYEAGHDLAVPKAQRDQLDWLAEVLEIEGPPVEGAETGP